VVAVECVAAAAVAAADCALPGYRRRIADADAMENLRHTIHRLFISKVHRLLRIFNRQIFWLLSSTLFIVFGKYK